MKKIMLLVCAAILATTGIANAWSSYNYVSAEELKGWLEVDKPILIVDIQVKNEFATHHIKESLETDAYPVKSEEERHLLDPALTKNGVNGYEMVVVVCPRGKGGAKRAYEYLHKQGIPEAKLSILTGGMGKWPYQKWVASK